MADKILMLMLLIVEILILDTMSLTIPVIAISVLIIAYEMSAEVRHEVKEDINLAIDELLDQYLI